MTRFAERLERRRLFAITVFTVDPTLSALTLDGQAAGYDFKRQADGSLRARYDGAIVADYSPGTSIRFLGGSEVVAEMRGRFDPGNAPGNYAAEVRQFGVSVFEGVVRRLQLDLFSDLIPVSGGNFASSAERVRTTAGRFSYSTPVLDDSFDLGGKEIANKTATPSSVITGIDGTTRLTIPVDVTYQYDTVGSSAEFHLTGQVVATAGPDNGLRPRVDADGSALGSSFAGVFTTGGAAVPAVATGDDGLRITDFDSTALVSATAVLPSRPDGAAEVLAVDTAGTGLTAAYDDVAGVLTISGSATPAVYQQVLRTLTYADTAATPTLGDRTVRVTASDALGAGPAVDNVISVEEPFNVNVARVGAGENKSLTFADADGTLTTITLSGGGVVTVRLNGAEQQTPRKGASVLVTGTAIQLVKLEVTGTSPLSRLNVRTSGGNGAVDLGGATVDGPLATFGGKGVNATGALDFDGRVNTLSLRDVVSATITAPGFGKLNVAGSVVASSLTAEDAFNPLLPAIGNLQVKGTITGSRVAAAGTINAVKAAGLVNSEVYAGVVGADRFPSTAADFGNEAAIRKLTLKAAPGVAAFDNSVVAANNLGKIVLGLVDTDNAASPFGVAADTFASVSGSNAAGQKLRLSKLDDPALLAAALPALDFAFGDLQIRLV